MSIPRTDFDRLASGRARLVLLVLALVTLVLIIIGVMAEPPPDVPEGRGDLGTYQKIVTRLQAGEPYYPALHAELVDGGYGTRSVFNWRPPVFLEMIALLGTPAVAQGVLVTLSFLVVALAGWLVIGTGGAVLALLVGLCLLLGQMATIAPNAALLCELWAGPMILLSVTAYGLRWPWLGFAAGLSALFLREISGLYVLVAILFALRAGRRAELVAWGLGLAVFAAYFAWHYAMSMALVLPSDPAYKDSWLQFGGAVFVLATAQFNGLFLLLPQWVTGLVLPLAVLGLIGWRNEAGRIGAATVLGYLVLFAGFGRPANGYWGALYTPLLMLGLPWGVVALRDLVSAAWRPTGRRGEIA